MQSLSKLPLIFSLFLVLISSQAYSQATDAQTLFRYGVEAFERGQLQEARLYLEHARKQGLQSASLSYNLGVLYYQLAEYELAKIEFGQLLGTRHQALATYNLGLIALKQEQSDTARTAFESVLQQTPPENLATLAQRQLDRLAGAAEVPVAAPKDWYGFISVAGGYEDNIALFPDSARSDLEGGFAEAVAAGSGFLYGDRNRGLRGDVGLYLRHYASEDDFDSELAQVNLQWRQLIGPGRLGFGAGGAWVRRGGEPQERHSRAMLSYRLAGCGNWFDSESCLLKLTATDVSAEAGFDAYEGQLYQLDARYRARWQAWTGELKYRGDYNAREDLTTGAEFYSVSPQRHGLELSIAHPVWQRLELELRTGYRYSYYRDRHRLNSGDGGTLAVRREDHRWRAGLRAKVELPAGFAVFTEYDYKANLSSIDRYEYTNQYALLGLELSF
ncbi:tetratricopeptide repeat protein [Marinobacter sp. SS21]|uniref:tetratricopeptide repeat protein n=1 Tax=Marinobacter sp. SS21 TaxID=2979460 RepID=UPI0023304B7E|nr:tetratricopeptide repeat protein [Marinobacter sp. SS21]MDC0661284.1 hypothetical protein [Marinobacter sp. SS21]